MGRESKKHPMEEVRRLWREGLSHEQIAEQTGIQITAVRAWTYEMPGGPDHATSRD